METCRRCDSPIVGRTKRAVFCSYHCKEQWHLEKHKLETGQRLAGRLCAVCDQPISSRSGKAKTCSRECGIAWQNAKRRAIQLAAWEARKQPCPHCGSELPESRWGATYCSVKCKRAALSARWRERSPGYMRQYLYGLTPEQYAALLAAQGGRCAICRADTPGGKGGWHVDHDHATKAIRGLLCGNCNNGLGNFHDDPAHLQAAIAYLTSPP